MSEESDVQPTSDAPSPDRNSAGDDHASWAVDGDEPEAVQADPEPAAQDDDAPAPEPDGEPQEDEPDGELEGDDEPPEFWSAERKALWAKVTDPEVRAAIKEHVSEASRATAQKMEEAAAQARAAEEASKAAVDGQTAIANWWQQNGPVIAQLVQGRWAKVDWNKLAAEDPAQWAALKQQQENEIAFMRNAQETHAAEIEKVRKRQETAHQAERRAHHEKLAAELPKEFGSREAAEKTYTELSGYLAKQGIPADRIGQVYEASIVKIVRKAYLYDQLQQKAQGITNPKPATAPASKTPKRVVPGAANPAANPVNEATRQAVERLKSGERLSAEEAGWAFR